MPGCCEQVYHQNSYRGSPCARAGIVDRGGKFYCKQHDPEAVAAKRIARNAKWESDWAESNRKLAETERLKQFSIAAVDAIHQIAAGHNDPRGLALDVIGKFAAA